jgi:hypothetical protein
LIEAHCLRPIVLSLKLKYRDAVSTPQQSIVLLANFERQMSAKYLACQQDER